MFVQMSKDILSRESKALGNFTTRQMVFGATGLVLGLAVGFSSATSGMTTANRITLGVVLALIPILWGWTKLYGQNLETILPVLLWDNVINPTKRFYRPELECVVDYQKRVLGIREEIMKEEGKKKKKSEEDPNLSKIFYPNRPEAKREPAQPSKDPALRAIR